MPASVAGPAQNGKAQSKTQASVLDTSLAALKKENESLRSELISVWNTLAQAEQKRTKDQETSQKAIADLQEQVDRFQVVMQSQDESVKKAERSLQDLDRSVTQQGNILQELGRRSTRVNPDPIPSPSVAVTTPETPTPPPDISQPVVSEEIFPSALPTVDLNTVPAAALVRGLSLTRQEAQDIVKHRPYKRIGELVSMNVIPKATFDRIRKQLVISAPAE